MKRIFTLLMILSSVCTLAAHSKGDNKGWVIEADSKENYNGVTMANGRIGIVSGAGLFEVNDIVLNGVYDKVREGDVSRIVRGPLFTNLELRVNGKLITEEDITDWKQSLNMREATVCTEVKTKEVMDVNGPAMGRCILSVLYSQIGDKENAFKYFQNCYIPHKRPPFGVLSESANSNNPYFCTGAGGMLQAVLSGFGGLRITEDGIVQENPLLPEGWDSITITGVGPEKKTYSISK